MKLGSNKTANIIAILAVIISAFALFVSIRSEYKEEQEELNIYIQRLHENYTVEPKILLDDLVIPTFWTFTITNNSQKTISIIAIEFETSENNNIINYSGLFQGIYEELEKATELPFNIEPGKSLKPIFKLGVLTNDSSIVKFKSSPNYSKYFGNNKEKWRRFNQILEDFASVQTDFFGNDVYARFENEKLLKYEVTGPFTQQKFIVKILLGSGKVIEQEFGYYTNQ